MKYYFSTMDILINDAFNRTINELVDKASGRLKPKRVIFNGKTTIVYFTDGDKVVVNCAENEEFNEEVGVAMAIVRKLYSGNRSEFLRLVENAYRQPQYEKTKKSKE